MFIKVSKATGNVVGHEYSLLGEYTISEADSTDQVSVIELPDDMDYLNNPSSDFKYQNGAFVELTDVKERMDLHIESLIINTGKSQAEATTIIEALAAAHGMNP